MLKSTIELPSEYSPERTSENSHPLTFAILEASEVFGPVQLSELTFAIHFAFFELAEISATEKASPCVLAEAIVLIAFVVPDILRAIIGQIFSLAGSLASLKIAFIYGPVFQDFFAGAACLTAHEASSEDTSIRPSKHCDAIGSVISEFTRYLCAVFPRFHSFSTSLSFGCLTDIARLRPDLFSSAGHKAIFIELSDELDS